MNELLKEITKELIALAEKNDSQIKGPHDEFTMGIATGIRESIMLIERKQNEN